MASAEERAAEDTLAFLCANRAPGKRQIRVVNREELSSLSALMGGGSDDEDDDDFCATQHDHDNSSDGSDDTGEDNSDDGEDDGEESEDGSEDDSDGNDGGSNESDEDNEKGDKSTSKKSIVQGRESVEIVESSDDDNENDEEEKHEIAQDENSNSMGISDSMGDGGARNSGLTTPRDEASMDAAAAMKTENKLVCCLCLNFDHGEVVQCDNCGLTVHEGCYGFGDEDGSVSSLGSSETTEPWFCEPCLAGSRPDDLYCELCPNKGGAFKRLEYGGHWIHLLCALYVSECSFGALDRLSPVNVFDVGYARFGSKSCVACQKGGNRLAARMGICSKCDAGMCKVYYHVTCAQKAGLLVPSASANGSDDQHHTTADPYYFCCPSHSDRHAMKLKMKRFQQLEQQQKRHQQRSLTPREQRVLARRRDRFLDDARATKPSWMPSIEKWQRLVPTSSTFFNKMGRKAEIVDGMPREEWEGEFKVSFTADMMGKFIMPAAFSSDFVNYFSEREKMIPTVQIRIEQLTESNNTKRAAQENLKRAFDKIDEDKRKLDGDLKEDHRMLTSICVDLKKLGCKTTQQPKPLAPPSTPSAPANASSVVNGLTRPSFASPSASSSNKVAATVSKQAETRNGSMKRRGSSQKSPNMANSRSSTSSATSIQRRPSSGGVDDPSVDGIRIRQCAECSQSHDQHLMAHCDTCRKHYHIACLDPPLTKLPRKSSLYGWECAKCFDPSPNHSDSEPDVNAPRQLRAQRKPVVRFTSDEIYDGAELNSILNSHAFQRRAWLPKRKGGGDTTDSSTNDSPIINKKAKTDSEQPKENEMDESTEQQQEESVDDPSPHVNDSIDDHSAMAREVDTEKMHVKIAISVDAVVKRVLGERRTGNHQFVRRVKKKKQSSIGGLEEERDEDDSGTSEGSIELHATGKNVTPAGHRSYSLPRGNVEDVEMEEEEDVQVIRVEDLD